MLSNVGTITAWFNGDNGPFTLPLVDGPTLQADSTYLYTYSLSASKNMDVANRTDTVRFYNVDKNGDKSPMLAAISLSQKANPYKAIVKSVELKSSSNEVFDSSNRMTLAVGDHNGYTMNVEIDEDYVKDVFGDNPVQWHVYSDAPDVVKVYQLNGLCYVQALKEGTASIYISHQYVAEDRFSELEYIHYVCIATISTKQAYFELLSQIKGNENPLANSEVLKMVQDRLASFGFTSAGIDTLIGCVSAAEEPYRRLYLYTLFDYSLEYNCQCKAENGQDPLYAISTFSPSERKIHFVGSISTTTFFHEVGHAIDHSANMRSMEGELYYGLQESVKSIVLNEIDKQATALSVSLSTEERNQMLYTVCGAENAPYYDMTSEYEWIIREVEPLDSQLSMLPLVYQKVMSGLYLKLLGLGILEGNTSNAYIATDAITGLIDQGVVDKKIFVGHPKGYFYQDSGMPNGKLCMEAWAEFYSAKLTGNTKANDNNYANFLKACTRMEVLADQMLKGFQE